MLFIHSSSKVGCLIDLIQANLDLVRAYLMKQLLVMFLISLAVIICWTKFLSLFEIANGGKFKTQMYQVMFSEIYCR